MKAYDSSRCALGPALLSDLEFVATHMRADERAQWCANTGRTEYDPWLCARALAAQPGPQFTLLCPSGRVLAVGGFIEQRPRVWQTWAAAIEGAWDLYWPDITAHCREQMDRLFQTGQAQRIETVALASRTAAHRWYRKGLRQKHEATMPCFFADGQAAVLYARTIED